MNGRTIQKEVEVKLELPPASLRALKKVPLFKTPPKHTREVSVYFDTDKHKLRKNGLMLRVRRVRNRVWTANVVFMLFCCSSFRLPYRSRRRTQDDALWHLARRNETPHLQRLRRKKLMK